MDWKSPVKLSDSERTRLEEIVCKKRGSTGRLRRARILLQADSLSERIDFETIAKEHQASVSTVRRVCTRYRQGGLQASVFASRFTETIELTDDERLALHGILADPSSNRLNIKKAKILLEADLQGRDADVLEIAQSADTIERTVINTLNLFLRSGLDAVLVSPCTFRFHLKEKDRILLQKCLKNKDTFSKLNPNKRTRILVLLNADGRHSSKTLEEIAKSVGVQPNTVRTVCRKYRDSGLDSVINFSSHRYKTPKRRHTVNLDTSERSTLKRIVNLSEGTRLKQRARILLYADENGHNLHNDEIAELVDVRIQTVVDVCKRYNNRGLTDTLRKNVEQKDKRPFKKIAKPLGWYLDIRLTKNEREELRKILADSKCPKGRQNRAKILLKVNELRGNAIVTELTQELGVSRTTIRNTCVRYLNEGFETSVNHKQMTSPSRVFALDDNQEKKVVKMFRSRPPKGVTKWTLDILAEQAVATKIVSKVSRETVRKVLRKHGISLSVKSQLAGRRGNFGGV